MPVAQTTDCGAIWYLERGSGVPLVLVHGAGGTSRHWGYQLGGLKDVAHMLALDLPGHGRSSGRASRTIAEVATCVLQWMDALHLPRAVVMGHSMGGAITQWLALNAPERVLGIVLVGTGARLRVDPQILKGIERDFAAATRLITERAYHPDATNEIIAQAVAELRAMPPATLQRDYEACDAWDAMPSVGNIKPPTLIVVGDQDQLTPVRYSAWLHTHIAGSQLAVVPRAGHMVMVEQAQVVNRTVGDWLIGAILPMIRYNSPSS